MVTPSKPMVIEPVKEIPQLGRFAIRDMGTTVGCRHVHKRGTTLRPNFFGVNMQKARIRLSGTNPLMLDDICNQVKGIAQRTGVHHGRTYSIAHEKDGRSLQEES